MFLSVKILGKSERLNRLDSVCTQCIVFPTSYLRLSNLEQVLRQKVSQRIIVTEYLDYIRYI